MKILKIFPPFRLPPKLVVPYKYPSFAAVNALSGEEPFVPFNDARTVN
jgi:hypothetical protein